eukprot:952995-Ditylum_brightwellii.AAC.1
MLTTHGFHHPKSSVHRLYLHRSRGGRGLTRVEATHDCKCSGLTKYVVENDDALTKVVHKTPTPTQKFLMNFATKSKYVLPIILDNMQHSALLAKPMHRKFLAQQKETLQVDLDQLHHWLRHANLICETEAAICFAQDQAMATNYICITIYKHAVNPLCCMCGTKYTEWHNKVCTYLHWCILKDVQRHVVPNWQQHMAAETPSICLEDGNTLMYNMKQCVYHAVTANRPNIAILDKKKKMALLIIVTCPMDVNMITAAATKHKKCCDLEIAMKKQFHLCKIQTVPIVIGALGTLCQNFDTNLAKVSPKHVLPQSRRKFFWGRHTYSSTYLQTRFYNHKPHNLGSWLAPGRIV